MVVGVGMGVEVGVRFGGVFCMGIRGGGGGGGCWDGC